MGSLSMPLFIIFLTSIALTESETSWRLDVGVGKVMPISSFPQPPPPTPPANDAIMDILLTTVTDPDGIWKKTSQQGFCHGGCTNNRGLQQERHEEDEGDDLKLLDCGKPVNFTYYDHLVGIQNRNTHPHIPEPEVAQTFRSTVNGKKSSSGKQVNIDAIERKLKKARREKPKSVELYNQIGNFWRIKGDTQKSIECFRRALAVSPNNAEILLNLARVLFNLQYLDDAIFLTRRSLEVQPPDQNAWMQHFQLGEILKAYCHYQEAALHLRHVLELKPNYQPALAALQDMEAIPDSTVHIYTILIIVFLVVAVLLWILSSLDISLEDLLRKSEANGTSTGKYPFRKFPVRNKRLVT